MLVESGVEFVPSNVGSHTLSYPVRMRWEVSLTQEALSRSPCSGQKLFFFNFNIILKICSNQFSMNEYSLYSQHSVRLFGVLQC